MAKSSTLAATGAAAAALLLGGAPTGAFAQQAADDGLQEITVTAQRRAENIQNVPIAVSAFSNSDLVDRQVNTTLDLVNQVPNLIGHNNTGLGAANAYYLRGLGNTESIATFDPPVGTYVDDIYIARQTLNNFGLFDVDRIEVLRGPQGTLFGRNTTGGAISVILNKPATDFGGYAEFGGGAYGTLEGRASVDLPVTDKILTKLSVFGNGDDGYVKDPAAGRMLNQSKYWGVRLGTLVKFTDNIEWNASASYIQDQSENTLDFEASNGDRVANTGLVKGGLIGTLIGDKADFDPGTDTRSVLLTSDFDIKLDSVDINFITGYVRTLQDFALDFFNLPVPTGGFTIANAAKFNQYSQEVKLNGDLFDGRLSYVGGFYFFHEDDKTDYDEVFSSLLFGIPGPNFGITLFDRTLLNSTDAEAVYGQFDYHLTQDLTFTAGARYTDEKKDLEIHDNGNPFVSPANKFDTAGLVAAGIPTSLHAPIFTPRFVLTYKPEQDISLYGSVTKGFKSGGWNVRVGPAGQFLPFSPEKDWTYEVGAKTAFFDRHLILNVTGFWSDDQRFQFPTAYASGGTITFLTLNDADLETYGGEFELKWLPTRNLRINSSLGVAHGYYTNLGATTLAQQQQCRTTGANCAQGIVDQNGNIAEPVRVPNVTWNLNASYRFEFENGYSLTPVIGINLESAHAVGTAGSADSKTAYQLANGSTQYVGTQYTIDFGLTFAPESQNWSITAECKNCTDRTNINSWLVYNYIDKPAWWDVRVRTNF